MWRNSASRTCNHVEGGRTMKHLIRKAKENWSGMLMGILLRGPYLVGFIHVLDNMPRKHVIM